MSLIIKPTNVVTITSTVPMPPMECPYCGGLGYVEVDVGQLYECNICKTKGYIEMTDPIPGTQEEIYVPR